MHRLIISIVCMLKNNRADPLTCERISPDRAQALTCERISRERADALTSERISLVLIRF